MRNNIEKSLILNRKIVLELRFKPVAKFLDVKGSILDELFEQNIIKGGQWTIGDSGFKIADHTEETLVRNLLVMEVNRFALISSNIQSVESFISDVFKSYEIIKTHLGNITLNRIGCRIQGTYKTKSRKFNQILKKFEEEFPSTIFLKDFPTTDLRLQIVYQNGTYHVGPIQENDNFLNKEFRHPERNNDPGIAIDTDNYLLRTDNQEINSKSKIKDVITASLAVEKSLVEKLKDF
ncbi:hypothetical protein GUB10_04535 [Salegentibacter sp. BLCTC]|uniref:hypothetical protein n=1 Tax=Salegentibacter sp. BLCTC TaxID=2697368 RepID=UPI00187BC348|nr:hypothetical protein [Salegentibacter sp. BLCTC]MBE7639593.1 hypothetical protein [Salegentibacter sp. BLCTC]